MELDRLGPLLLVIAGLTMIVGVAGALAQDDVKRILSFHVVSQIGYMIMGLGLFTVAGVAGAVLFLIHQIPVKTVMFLAGGLIEDDQGTSALKKVGGLASSKPVIAVLFALPALSLAGLPPFSGFVAKLALVDAGMSSGAYVIVAVSLVGSILTLLSMTKIWVGAFWGEVTPSAVPASSRRSVTIMETAAGIAVAGTIAVAVVAGPLWRMSEEVATDLLDRSPYIVDVLGGAVGVEEAD
jgi:multicomponent Na+:H+ antiporter subunit D